MVSPYQTLVQEETDLQKKAEGIFSQLRASRETLRKDPENEDLIEKVNALSTDYEAATGELKSVKAQIAEEDAHRETMRSAARRRFEEDTDEDERAEYVKKTAQKEARPFESLGEQLQAIRAAKYGNAEAVQRLKVNAAAQGAGEAIDSDGGFLVQTDFANEIMSKMAQSNLLSRVRRLSLGPNSNAIDINVSAETSRATGSRWGGVQGYWVDEGTAPTASKPKFDRVELKLKKVAALGYATEELLQDASALDSVMTQAFAEELTFLVEDSIINGTGAGQPLGILNSNAEVSVSKETGQGAATLVYENIVNMWARMWSRSRSNAVWLINQDIEPQLFSMSLAVGTGGVPVYLPANGLSGSPFATLMGRPVIPMEYAATLGTVGDITLMDLSQYGLIDKGGVRQAQSIHVAFTTDETAFRATYRVDGQPMWKSALTPFKGSDTQSPFISLATRS